MTGNLLGDQRRSLAGRDGVPSQGRPPSGVWVFTVVRVGRIQWFLIQGIRKLRVSCSSPRIRGVKFAVGR